MTWYVSAILLTFTDTSSCCVGKFWSGSSFRSFRLIADFHQVCSIVVPNAPNTTNVSRLQSVESLRIYRAGPSSMRGCGLIPVLQVKPQVFKLPLACNCTLGAYVIWMHDQNIFYLQWVSFVAPFTSEGEGIWRWRQKSRPEVSTLVASQVTIQMLTF